LRYFDDVVGMRPRAVGRALDRRDERPYRRAADRRPAMTPRVSVVVPAMNEAANLPSVFATIPSWVDEIVLVDGCSTDETVEVARRLRPDVKIVLQGGADKGDALVTGLNAAAGDIIVAIDGNGSTDGAQIERFVSALMSGADFAKGSRFTSAGAGDITPIRKFGDKALNVLVNRLYGTNFGDLRCGYNAFWARHLGTLALDGPGFDAETLISIRAATGGLRICEVPSHERLRRHRAGDLSAIRDGWRTLRLVIGEKRASARRKAHRPRPFMAPAYLAHDGRPTAAPAGSPPRAGAPALRLVTPANEHRAIWQERNVAARVGSVAPVEV
jgi:hypothetical protein